MKFWTNVQCSGRTREHQYGLPVFPGWSKLMLDSHESCSWNTQISVECSQPLQMHTNTVIQWLNTSTVLYVTVTTHYWVYCLLHSHLRTIQRTPIHHKRTHPPLYLIGIFFCGHHEQFQSLKASRKKPVRTVEFIIGCIYQGEEPRFWPIWLSSKNSALQKTSSTHKANLA